MNKVKKIIEYISNCKNIIRQISIYGDNLKFETWIHRDTIKISDEYTLKTPNICFDVVKYTTMLGETPYRFTLHSESELMRYPQHRKLFNRLFAPIIFKKCRKRYKQIGKQK